MKIFKPTHFPSLLTQIHNPPKKLHYQGQPTALHKTCIAIVGTRRYTEYGEYMTQKIVKDLATYDITIVSGLAKGIDTFAHKAALANNLPTIAVLGTGLRNIFPKENIPLAQEITKTGLLISEYQPSAPGLKAHFPQRNRIISGLSIATIVIEAPLRSGALITARMALEEGRDICVVPGDIHRSNSEGILRLLQTGGAYPVSSGHEVIEYLRNQSHLFKENSSTTTPQKLLIPILTPAQKTITSILSTHRGTSLEEIHQKTTLPTPTLLANLSLLEIKGLIKSKNGKFTLQH